MILDLVSLENDTLSVLSKVSATVEKSEKINELIDNMIETMYANKGIGLSAVQVNILKRLFVMDIPEITDGPMVFINPIIKKFSNQLNTAEEGCLSLPKLQLEVERPKEIMVEFRDRDWKKKKLTAEGIMAICIQHEIDHLDGILILSRIHKKIKKNTIKKLNEFNYLFNPLKIANLTYE